MREPPPALLVVAAFSHWPDALAWGRQRLEGEFGPVALPPLEFDFDQTTYYEATMGPALRKQLLAFHDLVPPDSLPRFKRLTIALERDLADASRYPVPRPLNLDPGLLSLGKFLLATTKDQAHRVYLGDAIFAEVTLHYHAGAWGPWPWTYADYRQPCVLDFLRRARSFYKQRLMEGPGDE